MEVLHKIARGSQGVAVIEGDELHLVLPSDVDQIGATAPVIDAGPPADDGRVGVSVSTVRPLLPPLINSAVVVARLLQKHGYDAEVTAQFKVRRPGAAKAVGWGEFCYGPAASDHARLYTRVTEGRRAGHPVAVFGRVAAVERDRHRRPVLRLADGRGGFTVRIRTDHPPLLDSLVAGCFVLAVGAWKVWTPAKARPELQLFAEEHWQLAHWTYDDATGRSSPPSCPPPVTKAAPRRPPVPAAIRAPARRRPAVSFSGPRRSRPVGSAPSPVQREDSAAPDAQSPLPPKLGVPGSPPSRFVPPVPEKPPLPPMPAVPPPRPPSPPPAAPSRRPTRRWWPFGRKR
ncbi:hypothetical protein H3147_05735 [Streptomyces sp. OF8]|uniref:Uncharacterized protein n=1 Tax=Streptomyces alkaliterrae TaxID=2213162 RepID=A0A7W3WUB5_9ACTN|nr:hypothetical protein [Streptomyces alkaliterrae]